MKINARTSSPKMLLGLILFGWTVLFVLVMSNLLVAHAEAADFKIVLFPDTQNESASFPAVFNSQTTWIANNRTSQNIVFATHLGDIVNTANSNPQWVNADTAMDILDAGNVAYSVGPGNHDMGTGSLYETYFGISRFQAKSWYGGHFGTDNYNNYSLFSASGLDFILINLQYSPTSAMLNWADARLKQYAARRGILVSHEILSPDSSLSSEGTPIFNALKNNPNLFLMLCGHAGVAYLAEQGDDGHTIHIMMADYEGEQDGGNGYLRILTFSPVNNKISATTYSPYDGSYITTYPDTMDMFYDMHGTTPSDTPTVTNTPDLSATATFTPTLTNTPTKTATLTFTPTWTITRTPSVTPSRTPTATNTPSPTVTDTFTPSKTYTPTKTATKTLTPTETDTPTATETLTPSPTRTNTPTKTATRTPTPTATNTPTATATLVPTYILTILSDHGIVTRNPDKAGYTSGEVVELTARPAAGWAFDSWSGDAVGSSPVISVTMNGNRTVTAHYVRRYSVFLPLIMTH